MEKPIDFWLRTEGIAGSVIPTIEPSFSRFLATGAQLFQRENAPGIAKVYD